MSSHSKTASRVARHPMPGRRGKKHQQRDRLSGAEGNFLPIRGAQLEPAEKIDAPAVHPAHRQAGLA
jgi:hypothetical protein